MNRLHRWLISDAGQVAGLVVDREPRKQRGPFTVETSKGNIYWSWR